MSTEPTSKMEEVRTTEILEALLRKQDDERILLQHQIDHLRGRMIRKLTESIDMLTIGLSALRKDNSSRRILVMQERAEHVIDTLRDEVQKLTDSM